MGRAVAHALAVIFAFMVGVYADTAAYRAVDYFWPDVTPRDVRAGEVIECGRNKNGFREWSIKEFEEWNAKQEKPPKSASDRSPRRAHK